MNKLQKEIVWGVLLAVILFVTVVSALALEIRVGTSREIYFFLPNETSVGGVITGASCVGLAYFPIWNITPYFNSAVGEIGNGLYRFNLTTANNTGENLIYANCTKSNAVFSGAMILTVSETTTAQYLNDTRNIANNTLNNQSILYNAIISSNQSILDKMVVYNLTSYLKLIEIKTSLENINSTQQNNVSTMLSQLNVILNEIISVNGAKLNSTLLNLSYVRQDLSNILNNQSILFNSIVSSNYSASLNLSYIRNDINNSLNRINILNTSIMNNLNDARQNINLTLNDLININITNMERFLSISNNLTIVLNNISYLIYNLSNCSNSWQSGDWFCNKLFENYKIVNDSNQTLKSIKDDLFYINLTTLASNDSLNLMKNRIELEISTFPVWYYNTTFQAYFILKDYLGRLRTPDSYNITIWQNQSNYTWMWSNNSTIVSEGVLSINITFLDNMSAGVYWIGWNASLGGLNSTKIGVFRLSATAYDLSVIISTKEIEPSESVYFDVLLQNNGENEDDVHLTCSNYAEQKEEDILIQPHSQKTLSRSLITYENQERQDSVNCFIRYANSRTASASDTYSIFFKRVRHMGLIQIVKEQRFITFSSVLLVSGIIGAVSLFRLRKSKILNKTKIQSFH